MGSQVTTCTAELVRFVLFTALEGTYESWEFVYYKYVVFSTLSVNQTLTFGNKLNKIVQSANK